MKQLFSSFAVLAAIAISGTACAEGAAQAPPDTGIKQATYTEQNHPSLPCKLSEEAVKNWSDTSARLPAACTYDDSRLYESDVVASAGATNE